MYCVLSSIFFISISIYHCLSTSYNELFLYHLFLKHGLVWLKLQIICTWRIYRLL